MATVYGIRDWARYFAKGDAVKYKFWKFVPIPTNLNSEIFRILMKTSDGREAFTVFIVLVELSANLPRRGVLADERGALSAASIEIKTNIPAEVVEKAIDRLATDGWLVAEGSKEFQYSFGGSSETSEESAKNLPPNPSQSHPNPNPTQPNPFLSPSHPAKGNGASAGVPIGSGGNGIKWTPVSLERFLRACQVNPKTAAELGPHADKLDGIDLSAEWKRIKADRMRTDKSATLVGWVEKAAGVNRQSLGSVLKGMT